MKSASQVLDEEQTSLINEAVAEAESHTSAEIVPVLATVSGRYDRPEDMVGLWFGLILATLGYFLVPDAARVSNSWAPATSPVWKLLILLACMLLGFVGGAFVASRIAWLRRLFTPRRQMTDEVCLKARSVFYDARIHRTSGGTGLLIYVSLCERQAAFVADETVTEKLGQDAIDELCRELTSALQRGDMASAISQSLNSAGKRLGEVLPREPDDVNELPDSLVTID